MTPRQREVFEKYQELESFAKVADALKINKSTAREHYQKALKYQQTDQGIKDAMYDTGIADIGKVHSGWLKTDAASLYFVNPREEGGVDNLIDTFKEALKDCPTSLPTAKPEGTDGDLLTRYILTDLHFGMRAWAKEAGEDYDLDIAKSRLNYALSNLVQSTPDSKYTSYSVNKGEKVVLCLRSRNSKEELVDENILMFVALHEMGHICTKSIGHTEEFWTNFKWLLQKSIEI